LLIVY